MAKILILSLVFPPDGVSTSILYGALAEELKSLGHDITVLTTTPHYNEDCEARTSQPLSEHLRGLYYESDYHGIPVYHTPVPVKGNRVSRRFFDYSRFHAVSTMIGLTRIVGEYDIVLTPSPPLTIGLSAWLLGLIKRVPYIYNVQEIFPDIAVNLGVLKNRPIIKGLERLERFIYERSESVVVISEWFRRKLLQKEVPDNKIDVISNFTDTEFMRPGARRNAFSRAHGLDDKFVVLYAGNIGLTQNFENILAAAARLTHLKNLEILIVGDGARRVWLEEEIKKQGQPNVRLLDYQPRSLIPAMYAASDVCLVPLKGRMAQETFPSKIYTIMAAGRPAIVSADDDSELSWLVNKAECGWAVRPDDEAALAASIEDTYNRQSTLENFGHNGRVYVEQHHSRKAVAQQYDRLIRRILR